MNPGQQIMVYEDPLTEKIFEGTAKLLTKLEERPIHGGKLEHWKVRFIDDRYITTRVVRVKKGDDNYHGI